MLVAKTRLSWGLVSPPFSQPVSPGVKFEPRTDLLKGGRGYSATVSSLLVLTKYNEFMSMTRLYICP